MQKCFVTVNPGTKYLYNWHIKRIAEYLHSCENSEINRLIINIPPRYLKSFIVNVAWPAWLLGQDPTRRIISASYSNGLSIKHSLDCRAIIESEWYQELFPETRLTSDQNEKNKFMTTMRGFRLATSTGGTLTGEGGNFLILDDPNNPSHIMSKSIRDEVLRWYEQVFSTRLDDRNKGVIVLIMQRLHQEDLTGHLLEKKDVWNLLKLPAIDRDNILQAERQSLKELERTKAEMGSFAFSAQYLQNPLAVESGMVKPDWMRYYSEAPIQLKTITQSWDTAIKTGKDNDYSVCTTWGESHNAYYLLDMVRLKAEYPQLKRTIIFPYEKWKPERILMEDKASGQSLIQELRAESKLPVIAVKVNQDKVSRFASVTPLFEAGKIFFPTKCSFLADLEVEIFSFPESPHDDQIDSISQYLNWVRNEKLFQPNIRRF